MGVSKSRRPILAPQDTESVIPGAGTADFSETEFDTGRKWIDGKTIYAKVVDDTGGGTYSTGINDIAHGLDMADGVDRVISLTGFVKRNVNNQQIPVPYTSTASVAWLLSCSIQDTNIRFGLGTEWDGANTEILTDAQFIIEYTKQ